jgi:hypothetical protein
MSWHIPSAVSIHIWFKLFWHSLSFNPSNGTRPNQTHPISYSVALNVYTSKVKSVQGYMIKFLRRSICHSACEHAWKFLLAMSA